MLEQLDRLDAETADDLESDVLEIKAEPSGRSQLKRWAVEAAVGFANQRGGCLLVGIADRVRGRAQAITGIGGTSYIGLERDIYDATDPHILTDVEALSLPEGVVLAIHVPKGIPPHTTSDGTAKIRIGKQFVPLTGAMLARMIASAGSADLTSVPIEEATFEDLDPAAIERGRDRLRLRPELSRLTELNDGALLEALGLTNGRQVNRAALLLFGKPAAIARFIPQHEITVLRHTSRTSYDRRVDLRGPLVTGLDRVEDELASASSLRTIRPAGFAQLEIPTISWEVAREAIVNAIAHRDYFLSQGIVVALHDDRVEVSSPGGFLGGISPGNILRHPPVHRNELLARSLQQLGLGNRVGLGVDRIYEGLLRVGSEPPTYSADESSVSVTLPLGGSDEFAAWLVEYERDSEPLDLDDLIVLRQVVDSGTVDRRIAAARLQVGDEEAGARIGALRRRKLLINHGRGRGVSYGLPRPLSERLRGRPLTDADHPLEDESVRLRILDLLRERGRLTNAEIRDFSGYSRSRVLAIEKDLEREGMIEIRGKGRGAHIALREQAA